MFFPLSMGRVHQGITGNAQDESLFFVLAFGTFRLGPPVHKAFALSVGACALHAPKKRDPLQAGLFYLPKSYQ
jgi:hypothetical protein